MNKEPLTKTQEKTLNAIKKFHQKNGYMPTYQELAEILEQRPSSIFLTIRRIAAKGWIQQDRRPRMIKIL